MTKAGSPTTPPGILWLASYPKSGSTWLRALLTNYLARGAQRHSINALLGQRTANDRHLFDETLGIGSSDLTPAETLRLRPMFHSLLAETLTTPAFVKTHHAYLSDVRDGVPLFPSNAAAGAVYIVRNPLDVAVSFAHHENRSVGWAVKRMQDDDAVLEASHDGIKPLLPDALLSWSGHVSSWLDQREIRVRVVRYEDMHADPVRALAGVLRFAGFAPDPDRMRLAAENAAFPVLRAEEAAVGFNERNPRTGSFFRAGRIGDWRESLSKREALDLVSSHRRTMARLGYCDTPPTRLRGTVA